MVNTYEKPTSPEQTNKNKNKVLFSVYARFADTFTQYYMDYYVLNCKLVAYIFSIGENYFISCSSKFLGWNLVVHEKNVDQNSILRL